MKQEAADNSAAERERQQKIKDMNEKRRADEERKMAEMAAQQKYLLNTYFQFC